MLVGGVIAVFALRHLGALRVPRALALTFATFHIGLVAAHASTALLALTATPERLLDAPATVSTAFQIASVGGVISPAAALVYLALVAWCVWARWRHGPVPPA
ncbi:hypothetical protein [Pseudaestuariivita atlantica]|nr:hypothetical protein [Pseudaestuariivita atlantica]